MEPHAWVDVSIVCVGGYVAFEEIDDGIWSVYFAACDFSRFNERNTKIEGELGRLRLHSV